MSARFFFRNQSNMCRGLGKNRCHHLDHGRLAGNDRKWPHDVIRPRPTKVNFFSFKHIWFIYQSKYFFRGNKSLFRTWVRKSTPDELLRPKHFHMCECLGVSVGLVVCLWIFVFVCMCACVCRCVCAFVCGSVSLCDIFSFLNFRRGVRVKTNVL